MKSPSVSVVIPAYNSAATIARALDSVFSQTYRDFEVIVVDDGSTDALDEAIGPYLHSVRLHRQCNAGAAAARNCAVRIASGTLLAFLDADDFWHERKLELQVAAFTERPETSLCSTDQRHWYEGQPNPYVALPPGAKVAPIYSRDFRKTFRSPYLGTPGVMMPRALFMELGGFREDLKSAEDVDLWLRAAFQGLVAHIPHPLFYVVPQPDSLRALHHYGTYEDNLRVIADFCASHPEFARTEQSLVRSACSRVYEYWGADALVRGDLQIAQDALWNSLRNKRSMRAAYLWLKTLAVRGRRMIADYA